MLYIEQCNSNNQYIRYKYFSGSVYEDKNIITMIHDNDVLDMLPIAIKKINSLAPKTLFFLKM